ncbi:MAG: alpha-galactosidase [Clostridia bacterium]|nr:alpha-galactosidase [Clostridia bacterium]
MIHIAPSSLTGEPVFHLRAGDASYVFCVFHGYLLHLYCGPAVGEDDLTALLVKVGHDSVVPRPADTPEGWFSLDIAPQEFPVYGTGDYRPSALMVRRADGSAATSLRYVSHEALPGKPRLDSQPTVSADEDEADTLAVTLCDPGSGLRVRLYYTAMRTLPVIVRRAAAENPTSGPLTIERIASASLDFATWMEPAELLHLWGTWGRERTIERTPLAHGTVSVSSRRGASSHHHNPFAALVTARTTETAGPAIGLSLVYAGNFEIAADTDPFGSIRFQAGIESTDFAWRLDPGDTFVTPEAVLAISGDGLGRMSRTFHRLWRDHLCRGEWAKKERPVLVNNWEATYFRFDSEKLLAIAKDAADCGIEMLVMDDGWFGARNDDRSSLGDWFVNEEKLPGGLAPLVERINALGLKFGIWFEPEMISPVSRLFEAHPDWALGTAGRDRSVARSQYVLDMTRPDVRDYLFETISRVLSSANIEYVKWDFNRNLTEAASADLPPERQGEILHRYVLGLYDLLDRITAAYPHLLLEGCSSGGGRFDPAMLYYAPQYWTSDDTDAMERLDIQLGTTMVYPCSSMSCHVSASPNHQTRRETSFETRGHVAMGGAFGYELDLTTLTDEEKALIRKQVADYHRYYALINRGDFYRLILPADSVNGKTGRCAAWMTVSEDRAEALVTFVVIRASIHPVYFLRLEGLDPAAKYREEASGAVYGGAMLMNAGINLTGARKGGWTDGSSVVMHFVRV